MQGFVSVTFGYGEPVAQTFGIGHIHIGHNGIYLPAFLFFLVDGRVQNDSDGKQVIHSFEGTFLFLHFLIDGMDGLGTPFHVELQSCFFQLMLYRFDKGGYVFVTGGFRFVQFVLYMIIYVVFGIFQGKVFQFRFQFV